ncbi:hypothetical protein LINPERHAP1_LOCUS31803 [Linum perenne]
MGWSLLGIWVFEVWSSRWTLALLLICFSIMESRYTSTQRRFSASVSCVLETGQSIFAMSITRGTRWRIFLRAEVMTSRLDPICFLFLIVIWVTSLDTIVLAFLNRTTS